MNGSIASLALVLTTTALCTLGGCSAGDDVSGGARSACAAGGELTDCPDAERTAEAACWRLVDCGAIAVNAGENNQYRFDWDRCVDGLDGLTADRRRLVINCVATSSCDQLRVDGSPGDPDTDQMYCILLAGGRP